MMCLFQCKPNSTIEEFKLHLKKMQKRCLLLSAAGMLTIIFTILVPGSDRIHGFYLGLGTSLILGGLLLFFKNHRILQRESLLKEMRRQQLDERNIAISSKASSNSAITVLLGSYCGMLAGGLYDEKIFWCFCGIVALFFFAYSIFTAYYKLKM